MLGRSAALAAWVLLVGCGSGCSPEPGNGGWPGAPQAELTGTGLTLIGGTGEGEVVVDGAGMAWVDGPWQVARVDPATGAATIWDASDDSALANSEVVAPAQPAGVWLRDRDALRWFDGQRFAVELQVPERYLGADEGPVPEVLQVGSQLWVSGAAGVARWADGQWTAMGQGQVGPAGPLAVDTAGAVWAGFRVGQGDGARGATMRWDGSKWSTPSPGPAAPAGDIGDIAADPAGGIWVTSAAEGTAAHGVFRFVADTWTKVGVGGYAGDLSVAPSGEVWAMVSAGDGLAGADSTSLAQLAADGTWDAADDQSGAPQGNEWQWPRLALAGQTRLITDRVGLVRSAGDAYERAWSDPTAVVEPAFGIRPHGLVAVSADELWMPANHPTRPDGIVPATGLGHYVAGQWRTMDMPLAGDSPISPVLASDGAVWQVGRDGLYRVQDEQPTRVAKRPRDYEPTGLGAGPDGSVFTLVDGSVVRVPTTGAPTPIGHPKAGKFFYADLAHAGDVLWAGGIRGLVGRWDGRWSTVPLPGQYTWATELLAPGDGSLVAVLSDDTDQQALGSYVDGHWVVRTDPVRCLTLGPDGGVYALTGDGREVVGLDAALAVTSRMPVGAAATALAIGGDGTAWVLGEQVARLPSPAASVRPSTTP